MKNIARHVAIDIFYKAWFKTSPPELDETRFYIEQSDEGLKIIYNGNYATIIDRSLNILNLAGRDDQRHVYHQQRIHSFLRTYLKRQMVY